MKKISVILSLVFLILFSCNQNSDQDVRPADPGSPVTGSAQRDLSAARPIQPSFYPITLVNGQYISGYGGGITFGTEFIRYIVVDATGATDGEPSPGFEYVNPQLGNGAAQYFIDGDRFAIAIPGDDSEDPEMPEVDELFAIADNHWMTIDVGDWHNFSPDGGRVASYPDGGGDGTVDGIILIKGQVVRDHNSPTNASVVTDEYVYGGSGSGGGSNCPLALSGTTKSNKNFRFYVASGTATSGSICKVTATTSTNSPLTVSSYSLTYTSNGTTCHITGTVTIAGTTYSFNDTLSVYQI